MGRVLTQTTADVSKGSVDESGWKFRTGHHPRSEITLREKPTFGYYGSGQSTSGFISVFGKKALEPLLSMNVSYTSGYQEVANTEPGWWGDYIPRSYTTTLNTQTYSPESGYCNPHMMMDDAGSIANFYMTERGELKIPSHHGNSNNIRFEGIVVGEKGYSKGLSLQLNDRYLRSGKRYYALQGNPNTPSDTSKIDLVAQGCGTFANNLANLQGSVGYNRRTNTLMILEFVSNYNGFRIHTWKNLTKRFGYDPEANVALLKAAKDAGNYSFVDVTSNADGGYAGANQNGWMYNGKIVPCDDGSAWVMLRYTGGAYLYSFDGTNDLHLEKELSGSNMYGTEKGAYYCTKHAVTKDQSAIALYTQHYYYFMGINLFLCSTKSAVVVQEQNVTTYGYYQWGSNSNSACGVAANGDDSVLVSTRSDANVGTGQSETVYQFDLSNTNVSSKVLNTNNVEYVKWPSANVSTSHGGTGIMPLYPEIEDTTEYTEYTEMMGLRL